MTHSTLLFLVLASSCMNSGVHSSDCYDYWSYHHNGSESCVCGKSLDGGVMCYEHKIYLRIDHTMTLDTESNQTVVAYNIFGYDNYSTIRNRVYTLLPNDSQLLNQKICAPNNRKGFLCEQCIEGFGPTPFSPKCADCKKHSRVTRVAIYLTLKLLSSF